MMKKIEMTLDEFADLIIKSYGAGYQAAVEFFEEKQKVIV